jgi:hypothetical protein
MLNVGKIIKNHYCLFDNYFQEHQKNLITSIEIKKTVAIFKTSIFIIRKVKKSNMF